MVDLKEPGSMLSGSMLSGGTHHSFENLESSGGCPGYEIPQILEINPGCAVT